MPKYILKKRDIGEKKPRAYGGIVQTYYKWVTVSKHETLKEAGNSITGKGLIDEGIFFKGKRLNDLEIWKAVNSRV